MLGFYDYTVILTYLSIVSASTGIIVSLSGHGHPYIGVFFLLFCGLCDAFDGRVARMKKGRSHAEESFGIQIDSLSDLVAFGVLPACIGAAMMRTSPVMHSLALDCDRRAQRWIIVGVYCAVLILYCLAAMIRLAYFNVTEEERRTTEGGARKYYTGLPVTSASLIFPFIMLLQFVIPLDVTPAYFVTALITGIAFISPFRIKKPGLGGIFIMIGIGAVEFALVLIGKLLTKS